MERVMIIDKDIAPEVNAALLDWFSRNKRELPFRKERDAYKIWISEVMAQQTQIQTILPYYERFMERFPTVESLSEAPLDDVLNLWQGLGYYSRAKNLKKAADIIARKGFPDTYKELLKLPGVGPYTAGAIASIAFGEKVACVDGNVLRVISRIYASTQNISETRTKKIITDELNETLPDDAGAYNESLMELGALICTPKNPSCLLCPVRDLCRSYNEGLIEEIPVKGKAPKKEIQRQEALIVYAETGPLFIKRPDTGLLAGLDGFPITDYAGGKGVEELARAYNVADPIFLGSSKHTFTHRVWVTDVYAAGAFPASKLEEFTENPVSVPTAFAKMLKLFEEKML